MNAEKKNDFTKGKMWQVIARMSVPLILAQLVNVLYSVVDRMYIGHIPAVGSTALTGLGLTMPLISIITGFANMCGTGGGPLCSIARGKGDTDYAERVMGNAFTMLLILGAVITAVLLCFLKPILYLFGASDATYPYAAAYANIYFLGTLPVMVSLGMNFFINAQGFAKVGMLTVVCGAVVNIVLDPILIFGFDMGIKGAAIATVIAQTCSAAWAMKFLLSDKAILDLRLKNMALCPRIVGRVLSLGTTGFVMSATNGVVQIACNVQLRAFGSDLYVGAMTVINSVREVQLMIIHGVTSGSQPVLGYNYGAGELGRVKSGIKFVSAASVVYAFVAWLITMLIPDLLIKVFNSEPELVRITVPALRIYFCGFCFMSLQMAGQCTFVGLGKAKQAVFFSLLRKAFIVVPLIIFLPRLPLFGVLGVFWAEPISDLVGGISCFLTMYFTVYKKLDGTPARLSDV